MKENKKKQALCAIDITSASCATVGMIYYFVYSIALFPELAIDNVKKTTDTSSVGNLTGIFGSTLGISVFAILLAIIAFAAFLLCAAAVSMNVRCAVLLNKYDFYSIRKKYIIYQVFSGIFQIASCAAAYIAASGVFYLQFLPTVVLCAICLALLLVGYILKGVFLKNLNRRSDDVQSLSQ